MSGGAAVNLRRREDDWVVHIFREHHKEARAWAEKGASGLREEREDDGDFAWSDVSGICGFWDGSCRVIGCGADMWVHVPTHALAWHAVHEKCEFVPGPNSLDVEIFGCSMLLVV